MSEQIPSGWTRAPVCDLVEKHFSGPSPTCEERNIHSSNEWAVLKTTAVVWGGWNETAHKVLPKHLWGQKELEVQAGDVLVTKAGPRHRVGVVIHVPETQPHLIVSGKMIGLRVKRELCFPDVLAGAIALREPQKYLDDRTTGMAESQVNFSNKALLQTPVIMPPLVEQAVISQIKDVLDTQIRQTEALIAKLEHIKQGLLTDLLTRGIDQNGQLRPTPDQAPHLYKDSPLGWIPREWVANSLGSVVKLQGGYAFSSESFQEHGVRLARISNIKGDSIVGDFALLPWSFIDRYSDYAAKEGDVLIAMSGATTGKMAVVDNENLPMLINQRVGRFVVTERDYVLPSFLTFLLGTSHFKREIEIAAIGGAQPNISGRQIESIPLAFPPTGEQQKIEAAMQAFGKRILAEQASARKLHHDKAGLMDDLLTGRVRVAPLLEEAQQREG
ncbi:MAG: restriction endonuclease subunit S [Gammaproteobacteria bacterium]|nr:restriction endonuclease subunit S [Gammaproteobacteria bacterium]